MDRSLSLVCKFAEGGCYGCSSIVCGTEGLCRFHYGQGYLLCSFYERIVDEYKAELYIKGWANIRKKNHLLRFIPSMFRIKKGVREYMMETYSELHYTASDIYDQKVKASVGTTSELWELDGRLLEYFHINIYSSTLLYDKLLSPLAANAKKYYTYYIDSIMGEAHNREFRIRFMPKSKSFQLVGGYMIVSDNVWSVREIRFPGVPRCSVLIIR